MFYSLYKTIESIKEKLAIQPLLLQLPLEIGRDFHGVIDLVSCHAFIWSHNTTDYTHVPLKDVPPDIQSKVSYYREQLIEQVRSGQLG